MLSRSARTVQATDHNVVVSSVMNTQSELPNSTQKYVEFLQ